MTEWPQGGSGSGEEQRSEPAPQPYDRPLQPPPPGFTAGPAYGPGSPYGGGQGYGPGPAYGPGQAYGPGPAYGPPGYGAAQYPFPGAPFGPGHAPPKRRRRRALVLSLVALAVLVVAGVAVAFMVGPSVLSRTAVERDVAAQFQEIEGVSVDLHCPGSMKVQTGARYTCTGTTAEGEKVTLVIHIQSTGADPRYVWTEP